MSSGKSSLMLLKVFFLVALAQFIGSSLFANALPAPQFERSEPEEFEVLERRGAPKFVVKTSSDQTKWTKLSALPAMLATGPNKAVLWSGRVGTESVEGFAQDFAIKNGLTTLEMSLAKGGAIMPAFDQRNAAAVQLWTQASAIFAQGANGNVQAFLSRPLRVGNVYETEELPNLKKNSKVLTVTEIDQKTGKRTPAAGFKAKLRRAVKTTATKPVAKPVAKAPVKAATKAPVKAATKAPAAKTAAKPAVKPAAAKPAAKSAAAAKPSVSAKPPAGDCETFFARC